MKATGLKASHTGLVRRRCPMVLATMVAGLRERRAAMESRCCPMELFSRENGKSQSSSKANASFPMAKFTTVSGMKANLKDMESKFGLMAVATKDSGSRESRSVKASKLTKTAQQSEASGKAEFSLFWAMWVRVTIQT